MTNSDVNPLESMFGPLDGARIPGGCDACDAYQVPTKISYGIWRITVRHDHDCPVLARIHRSTQ